jgi:hypothetical protein
MGGQQFPINLSGLVVAGMLVLAALLNQPPLSSDRPPPAQIEAEPSGPFEDVPARIWEDPLEAAARAPKPRPEPRTEPPSKSVIHFDARCAPLDGYMDSDPVAEPPAPFAPAVGPGLRCKGTGTLGQGPAPANVPESNTIADYLSYLSTTGEPARLQLLPVLIDGAPYPATREARLRRRMAVHTALAAEGFHPLRADRIGVWTWKAAGDLSLPIPFEAFRKDAPVPASADFPAGERRIVLVLWLNDQALTREIASEGATLGEAGRKDYTGPLVLLDRLLGEIGFPESAAIPTGPFKFRSGTVRLIGPSSSDSLRTLYNELLGWFHWPGADCQGAYRHIDNGPRACADAGVWSDCPKGFAILSPLATAPWERLAKNETHPAGPWEILVGKDRQERCATIDVHRTITTDDVTIAALVDELRVRGVDPTRPAAHGSALSLWLSRLEPTGLLYGATPDPCGTRDHLVLISESDTKFGRTLPDLFVDEVQRLAEKDPSRGERGCSGKSIRGLHRFSYVRGLDGDAPKAPASAGAPGLPDIVSLATGTDAGFKEPALGTNQFDYLRRLTGQIAELDGSLRRANQGAIKAFAILGNDYFDKLLILQALKERFQSQLYLTTDLDAGYLDAKVFRWTRNLVIAAPFALTLRERFEYPEADRSDPGAGLRIDQGETPPFRHSIQTSLYLAVRAAVQGRETEVARLTAESRALRFEVGYGRFFQLDWPTASDQEPAARIHPLAEGPDGWTFLASHALSVALLVTASTLLILLALPGLRLRVFQLAVAPFTGGRKDLLRTLVLVGAGVVTLLALIRIGLHAADQPPGFPWGAVILLAAAWILPVLLLGSRGYLRANERLATGDGNPAPRRREAVIDLAFLLAGAILVAYQLGIAGGENRATGWPLAPALILGFFALWLAAISAAPLIQGPGGRANPEPPSTERQVLTQSVLILTAFYLAVALGWMLPIILSGREPFAWAGGVSLWPSEIIRLAAGWGAGLCLILGWHHLRNEDQRIADHFHLPTPRDTADEEPLPKRQRFADWYRDARAESLGGRPAEPRTSPPEGTTAEATPAGRNGTRRTGGGLGERICRLFGDRSPPCGDGLDASALWRQYLPHASFRARLRRVLPPALLFWGLSVLLVYGFSDPATPHRGEDAFWFDLLTGLFLVGLPFIALLVAAVDESRLCRGLLRKLGGGDLSWRLEGLTEDCKEVREDASAVRCALGYWVTTEFVAERTAPAARMIHLPLMITLFLLLSLSTRFDNWDAPASVLGLVALSVGLVLLASWRLRATAATIRESAMHDLRDEIMRIEHARAERPDDKLRQLLKRIESIHEGAYTRWYQEPVFQGVAWVVGIGAWIVTEYTKVGG